MKTTQYNEVELENGQLTIAGVTAPLEIWSPLGIRRSNWSGVPEDRQPAKIYHNANKALDGWDALEILICRALDELPEGASAERVIRRAVSLAAQAHALSEVTGAMRALGKIAVPSNINVWHQQRGAAALETAAHSLAVAAQKIAGV